MYRTASSNRAIGIAASTAMAAALLAGCATSNAPRADLSASQAEAALAGGQHQQAITHAEAAVLAEPHNASYRVTLGQAYLEAGRFASATTSFDDAIALGDLSPRTTLSKAIALMGQGNLADAAALLNARGEEIAPADLGLALALAGQPDRGIHLLSNAIRSGQNEVKTRQNLAYAYALAGRWREARLMAAQDVPADKIDDRIEQWAMTVQPEAWQARIAGLLDAPAGVVDSGQPVQLALANTPSVERLAAEAAPAEASETPVLAEAPVAGELPAVTEAPAPRSVVQLATASNPLPAPAPAPVSAQAPVAPTSFQSAFVPASAAAPAVIPTMPVAAVAQDAQRFTAPAVAPAAPRAAASTTRAVAAVSAAQSTHLVQLGSFSSEASAKRAWDIYVKRYPELAGHEMVISEAMVRGKHYFRVSAGGFGRSTSSAMCGRVKSSGGEGCFAYAEGRPLPGAIDRGTRLAMR